VSGPLPEKVFSVADVPVTVIEYASLTCRHCMNCHIKIWPAFKAKYVDKGKVRLMACEFPLDRLSTAGFTLARCADDAKGFRSSACSTRRRRAGRIRPSCSTR
jgi:protein-disulfide isomerase